MMKRITVMLTMVALMVAMMALTAMPASASVLGADIGATSVSAAGLLNVNQGGASVNVL
jgi:hypothetical protein